MAYIETVPEAGAAGVVADLFDADREGFGYVRNLTGVLALAPDVATAWLALNGAIKARMDLRRYELVTLAAARRLRSTYCSMAHGSVLLDQFLDADQLLAVASDHHQAELEPVDVAVMDLADKIVRDASSVTQADIDQLRSLGLSDQDVFDVVSAAAARCFFSKLLDGLGVQADAQYGELDPALRETLTVGRPLAAT
jgi:uncharacterized peroxidase-related enzyme